jgi:hypothetical protein
VFEITAHQTSLGVPSKDVAKVSDAKPEQVTSGSDLDVEYGIRNNYQCIQTSSNDNRCGYYALAIGILGLDGARQTRVFNRLGIDATVMSKVQAPYSKAFLMNVQEMIGDAIYDYALANRDDIVQSIIRQSNSELSANIIASELSGNTFIQADYLVGIGRSLDLNIVLHNHNATDGDIYIRNNNGNHYEGQLPIRMIQSLRVTEAEVDEDKFTSDVILDFVGAFDRLKGALGLDENELNWYETVLNDCLKTCSGNIKLKPYKANVRRLMMFYDELNIKNRSIPDHWRNKVEDLIAKGNKLKLKIDELGDGAFFDDISALSIVNNPCQKGFYIGLDQCMSLDSSFRHLLLKGITGSGKSWKFIIPNILKLVDQNAVVTDLDGTIYDKTHAQMRAKGYNVKRLNLMSRDNSGMYNPFEYLTNDSETLIEDVISAILINCNDGEKGDGNLQYWQSKVKQFLRIITQVMMYESTFSSDTSKTFNCLEKIVNEFEEENGQGSFHKNLGCFLHLYKRLTFDRLCELSQECVEKLESHNDDNVKRLKDSIDELINVNPKIESKGLEEAFGTMKGVAGSAVDPLRSKDLLAVMSGKDSMFDTLKQTDEKTIVYVCVKTSDIKNYSLILTLFFQDLFRIIREVNDPKKVDETKTRPMLCFMDEFGNYKINKFTAEATTLRKFKVGLMCAVQSRDQIEKNYGRTLLDDGFVTQLYLSFGKGDQYAKELSESSGLKEDLDGKVKPKLSAYDLMHMPDMRACLVHEGKETVIYDIKTPDPIPKVQANAAPVSERCDEHVFEINKKEEIC